MFLYIIDELIQIIDYKGININIKVVEKIRNYLRESSIIIQKNQPNKIKNLTCNFDIFNVMNERESNKYTVIGGWSLTSCELCVGFTRLFYPYFAGYLVYRLKLKIRIPYSFIICSIILITFLSMPRLEKEGYPIFNGIYEAIVIILIFSDSSKDLVNLILSDVKLRHKLANSL